MAINNNVIVQYNGFHPDNFYCWPKLLFLLLLYGSMTFISCVLCCIVWWPGMATNIVSVQYNGGFLPDIILLTQGDYLLRGTHLNVMEEVLFLQPMKQQFYTRDGKFVRTCLV